MDTTWKHIPIKKKDLEAYDNDPSNATHKVCIMIILLHNSLGGGGVKRLVLNITSTGHYSYETWDHKTIYYLQKARDKLT